VLQLEDHGRCGCDFVALIGQQTDFPGQCTTPVNARSLRKTATPIPHI
jgi:hypothetical protein